MVVKTLENTFILPETFGKFKMTPLTVKYFNFLPNMILFRMFRLVFSSLIWNQNQKRILYVVEKKMPPMVQKLVIIVFVSRAIINSLTDLESQQLIKQKHKFACGIYLEKCWSRLQWIEKEEQEKWNVSTVHNMHANWIVRQPYLRGHMDGFLRWAMIICHVPM